MSYSDQDSGNVFNNELNSILAFLLLILSFLGALASAFFHELANLNQHYTPLLLALFGFYWFYKKNVVGQLFTALAIIMLLNVINGSWS